MLNILSWLLGIIGLIIVIPATIPLLGWANYFAMPFLVEVDDAAERIYRGLVHGHAFEIAFPRRLAWPVRLASMLPYGLYFSMMRRVTG